MKYNLIFSGIYDNDHENTEEVLRDFMAGNLDIDHQVEFTSVHRFGKKNKKRARPIVAKFIYQCDLDQVLKSAKKLKGKPFQINQQFPEEIEQARKSLYPIMKEHRQKGDHVKLVRDILYINGQLYNPETEEEYSNPLRRDRPTPNRNRSVSNEGVESARHRKRDRDSLGSVLIIQNQSMNLSACVLIVTLKFCH